MIRFTAFLAAFFLHDRLDRTWIRWLCAGFAVVVVGVTGMEQVREIRTNFSDPRPFDFPHFWLFGQATASGANPYQPGVLQDLAAPLNPPDRLLTELFCWYPPPSQMLFLPLGWMEFGTALIAWSILQQVAMLLCIWLLWDAFARQTGWSGLLATTAFVMVLPATGETIFFTQTNFLLMATLLMFWRQQHRRLAGGWLALGMLVKPLAAIVLLYPLVRRQWRNLFVCGLAAAGLVVVSLGMFGTEMFSDYLFRNPVANDYPVRLATEGMNQSLLATFLRATGHDGSGSPIFLTGHLLMLAALIGATAICIHSFGDDRPEWSFALTVTLAIMIYPATMAHYSVMLVIPLLLLRYDGPGHWISMPLTAAVYYLVLVQATFFAMLLCWLAVVCIAAQRWKLVRSFKLREAVT